MNFSLNLSIYDSLYIDYGHLIQMDILFKILVYEGNQLTKIHLKFFKSRLYVEIIRVVLFKICSICFIFDFHIFKV